MSVMAYLLIANCLLLAVLLILAFFFYSSGPKQEKKESKVKGDLKRIKDQINGKKSNKLLS